MKMFIYIYNNNNNTGKALQPECDGASYWDVYGRKYNCK